MPHLNEFFLNGGTDRAARLGSALGSVAATGVYLMLLYVAIRALAAAV